MTKEKKEITISMEKLKLICQYYEIPIVVFFDNTSEEDLRRWIDKHKTANNISRRYHETLKRIKEFIDELHEEQLI
jgi:ribosomal protein L7Ae-like RNA K-turn-binding protein